MRKNIGSKVIPMRERHMQKREQENKETLKDFYMAANDQIQEISHDKFTLPLIKMQKTQSDDSIENFSIGTPLGDKTS